MASSANQKRTSVLQSDDFVARKHTVYTPLNMEEREIRLLQLQPGQWSDPISATLSVECLEDDPKYEAISYVWGDLDDCLEIKLHGLNFRVTVSQFTVLRRLRLEDRPRTLWIDATCIDQLNPAERGHQVGFMFDIYEASLETIIWFGETCDAYNSLPSRIIDGENPTIQNMNNAASLLSMKAKATIVLHSHRSLQPNAGGEKECVPERRLQPQCQRGASCIVPVAMRLLDILAKSPNGLEREHFRIDWTHPSNENLAVSRGCALSPIISAALKISQNPWWSRAWTLQESRLPRLDATVHIGPHQLTLRVVCQAAKHIESLGSGGAKWLALIARMSLTAPKKMWELGEAIQSGSTKSCTNSVAHSLLRLLFATETRHASDKRDLIYALLGLTDTGPQRLQADYGLSVDQVFTAATRHVVMEVADLRLLTGGLTTPHKDRHKLPSWVPDYSRRYAGWSTGIMRRGAFNSSREIRIRETINCEDPKTLMVAASRLSCVYHVGPAYSLGMKYSRDRLSARQTFGIWDLFVRSAYSWFLKAAGISRVDFSTDQVALIWRVCLHLKPEDEGEEVREVFGLVSDWLRRHHDDRGYEVGWDTEEQKQVPKATNITEPPFPHEIRMRIFAATCSSPKEGTVLFQTKDGRFGSSLPYVQPGDEVFIVGGSPMPLLLRTVHDDDASKAFTGSATTSDEPARKKKHKDSDMSGDEADRSNKANTRRQDADGRAHNTRRPRYRLVSTCYVDGIMFGEAVTPETEWSEIEII